MRSFFKKKYMRFTWPGALVLLIVIIILLLIRYCAGTPATGATVEKSVRRQESPTPRKETLPPTPPPPVVKARETTIQTPTPKQDEEYNAPQPSPTAIIHTPLTIVHREIRIPAYLSGWVNTGLSLETGQKIILKQLKGGWTVDEGRYRRVDGNGHTDDGKTDLVYHKEYKIIPSAHFGAIIGKIGDQDTDDNAFPIGIDRQVIMQKSGTLCLRINDKDAALADNAGSITVEITVE